MNLQLLRTFMVFIESKNMQEAAKALMLSQPAVTQQLKNLEYEVGKTLFTFEGKYKVPTKFGLELYERLRPDIVSLEKNWLLLKSQNEDPSRSLLKIAGRKEMIENLAPKVSFLGKLKYMSLPSEEAYDKLLKREIDVGILSFKPRHARIVSKKIHSIHSRWFIPDEKIKISQLQNKDIYRHAFVAYSSALPFLSEWCKHYHLDPVKLNVKVTIDNWFMVKSLCVEMNALSIVPENIDMHADFDRDIVPKQIIKPVEFHYAYHEDLRQVLQNGQFQIN